MEIFKTPATADEARPLVSVMTPVYNGEKFIRQCIESVLAQDYTNWEYVIVNNCSTDRTLEICQAYGKNDRRFRVFDNSVFVNADENHNIGFRHISPASKYCKVVSADDWIEPDCIRKLVAAAEAHPSIGLVGSYQRSQDTIRWTGLSPDITFISGREIARRNLLGELDIFGNPTSGLYRADLVRRNQSFLPHTEPHADTSVCYEVLKEADYGFVHEVLSTQRVHEGQISTRLHILSAATPAYVETIQDYGPTYLDEREFANRRAELIQGYYRYLGGCVLKLRGAGFWRFHARRFRELGHKMHLSRVLREAGKEVVEEMRHPLVAARKASAALRSKIRLA